MENELWYAREGKEEGVLCSQDIGCTLHQISRRLKSTKYALNRYVLSNSPPSWERKGDDKRNRKCQESTCRDCQEST